MQQNEIDIVTCKLNKLLGKMKNLHPCITGESKKKLKRKNRDLRFMQPGLINDFI